MYQAPPGLLREPFRWHRPYAGADELPLPLAESAFSKIQSRAADRASALVSKRDVTGISSLTPRPSRLAVTCSLIPQTYRCLPACAASRAIVSTARATWTKIRPYFSIAAAVTARVRQKSSCSHRVLPGQKMSAVSRLCWPPLAEWQPYPTTDTRTSPHPSPPIREPVFIASPPRQIDEGQSVGFARLANCASASSDNRSLPWLYCSAQAL